MHEPQFFSPETKMEKVEINLKDIRIFFCGDEQIEKYYREKTFPDYETWLDENRDKLLINKPKIDELVQQCILDDGRPETVWNWRKNEISSLTAEKVIKIKAELENNIQEIMDKVSAKLKKFLPNWTANQEYEINFTMNEDADFCNDGKKTTADLGRLTHKENYLEEVVKGLTHEIVHTWMKEGIMKGSDESKEETPESLKKSLIFGISGEGLAVLIGGQSLEEHYKKNGKNYKESIDDSFKMLEEILNSSDSDFLKNVGNNDFKNMGRCYVAGYEMAKAVLGRMGIDDFRKLVVECKENPERLIEEYQKVI